MSSKIIKNAKTVWVDDNIFDIPGSNLTIYTVKIEHDGERNLYKTMSDKIADETWSGDLELYVNAKGKEYIRQAPKEDTFTPSGAKGNKGGWQPKDDKNITLGLVFKTFCGIEGMLPQKPEHWDYIEKCTRKLIEISSRLSDTKEAPKEQTGYEKAKQTVNTLRKEDKAEDANIKDMLNKMYPDSYDDEY